jgi:hypothetical protein
MNESNEGAQVSLRAFFTFRPSLRGFVRPRGRLGRSRGMLRPFRTSLVLASLVIVAGCSGSGDADSDILSEWRNSTSQDSAAVATTSSTTPVVLPEIPADLDTTLPENYHIAAISNYILVKTASFDLIAVASEFDLANTTWKESLNARILDVRNAIREFEALTPSEEYAEQDKNLLDSMTRILEFTEQLEKAIEQMDFRMGADALTGLQDETNVLVTRGVFKEVSASTDGGVTTTSVP